MRWVTRTAVLAAAAATSLAAGWAAARAQRPLTWRFEGAAALKGWEMPAAGIGLDGGALQAVRPAADGPGTVSARMALPVEALRGRRLKLEARIRAEEVAQPPHRWNGVKFMLHVKSPGGDQWIQKDSLWGTFDWKPVRYRARIPQDAASATLVLGLENTTGRAWFDDVTVAVADPRQAEKPYPRSGPRLRGAMIGTTVDAEDLRVLAAWGANHVRWQLLWGGFPNGPADSADIPAYDRWLEGELQRLDRLLPVCEGLGIHVVVDLHTPPGGRDPRSVCRIFQERRFQDYFLAVWRRIVERVRRQKAVWGYDLVNEPVEGDVPPGLRSWNELALQAARLVRSLDPRRAIIVEPEPWGGAEAMDNLDSLPVEGVVYSFHMYHPFKYTHQGIYGNPTPLPWPATVDGRRWDRDALRAAMEPAVRFQKDTGCRIYVGEFSAIRWAPGAAAYLQELIGLFEEHGWDWAYHAFREWDGWSVEHGPLQGDARRALEETDRARVLKAGFARNRRPDP